MGQESLSVVRRSKREAGAGPGCYITIVSRGRHIGGWEWGAWGSWKRIVEIRNHIHANAFSLYTISHLMAKDF